MFDIIEYIIKFFDFSLNFIDKKNLYKLLVIIYFLI